MRFRPVFFSLFCKQGFELEVGRDTIYHKKKEVGV